MCFVIFFVSHFAPSVDVNIFNSLNHPGETPQVFSLALAIHCVHTIFIARQCCLTQNESIVVFYFFLCCIIKLESFDPLIHLKAWVFWVLEHYIVRTQFVHFCLADTWSDSSCIQQTCFGRVQEPTWGLCVYRVEPGSADPSEYFP